MTPQAITTSKLQIVSLSELLSKLPQYSDNHNFGSDINEANSLLLSSEVDVSKKIESYLKWMSRFQPCLFGRMSVHNSQGLSVDICWITESEIDLGDLYIINKIQAARRNWKDKAVTGTNQGFLIIFNSKRLAFAKPSVELLEVCKHISNLYFVEYAPIEDDTIYSEAIPLRDREGKLSLFKAAASIFYTGAHKKRNHDHRIPGGLMISINAIGHYANSLVLRGMVSSFSEAVDYVYNIALRSIGNGGIGNDKMHSSTWHNHDLSRPIEQCPMKQRPAYIPVDFCTSHYSGLYHTDVLITTSVITDSKEIDEVDGNYQHLETWSHLKIDYLVEKRIESKERDYGLFHGHPITDEAKYHNPWSPVRVYNSPSLTYGYLG